MSIGFAADLLVVASALILLGALVPLCRLILKLPTGAVRNYWNVMRAFVIAFLVGYLVYAWFFLGESKRVIDLIVPLIFFLSACFVWLNSVFSLRTTVNLLRIRLLEQENIEDPLTGVFNRRYLDQRLREEVARACRYGLPLSVLMLDIDHFKQVNDQYGHQVGDEVLAQFAGLVKGYLREPDVVARYGGEEFLVIAPQTCRQSAIDLAERLRTQVDSNRFNLSRVQTQSGLLEIRTTCSIGVASLGGDIAGVELLVRCADQNMYLAKQDGRNRVSADEFPAASANVERRFSRNSVGIARDVGNLASDARR